MKFDIPPPPYESVVISIEESEIIRVHQDVKVASTESKNYSKQKGHDCEVILQQYENISLHI